MKTNPARLSGCGADGAGHGIERPTEPATNPEARSSDKVSNFPPEALSMLHWAFGEAVRVSVRLFPEASGAMVKSSSVFGAVPTSSPRLMSPIRTGTASPVGKKLSAGRVPVNLDSRQYASLPQQAGRLGDAESLSNAAVAVAGSNSGIPRREYVRQGVKGIGSGRSLPEKDMVENPVGPTVGDERAVSVDFPVLNRHEFRPLRKCET